MYLAPPAPGQDIGDVLRRHAIQLSYGEPQEAKIGRHRSFWVKAGDALHACYEPNIDESYLKARVRPRLDRLQTRALLSGWQDLLASRSVGADAFLTCDDTWLELAPLVSVPERMWVLSPAQALDYFEHQLKKRGRYRYAANYHIDRPLYYERRVDDLVPRVRGSMMLVGSSDARHRNGDVFGYLVSIHTRLRYLMEARDFIAFSYYEPSSADGNDAAIYHLTHFLSVLTGVVDNLAWILGHLFHPAAETLKAGPGRVHVLNQKFRNELDGASAAVLQALDGHRPFLRMTKYLRDASAHREIAWSLGFDDRARDCGENLIEIDDRLSRIIPKRRTKDVFGQWGYKLADAVHVIEPYRFTTQVVLELRTILDDFLRITFPKAVPHSRVGDLADPGFAIPFSRDFV